MDMIDCFATDHAPHLKEEKQRGGCPGFTGLETALPLFLNAVNEGRLTLDDIVNKYHHNPKRILRLNENYGDNSYIEVNLDREYTISDDNLITRAGWSPFNGVKVKGCLERFVFKGECVYNNGLVNNLRIGQNVNVFKTNLIRKPCRRMSIQVDNHIENHIENQVENIKMDISSYYLNSDTFKLSSVLDVSQFDRDNLRTIFKNAGIIKQKLKRSGKLDILKGKTIGLFFDEPSSRTYGSFHVAIKKLGGDVLSLNNSNSSAKKGETLYDTLKCIESYCDLVVVRTSLKGILTDELQSRIKIPIINAGDGDGEHPTQALLDVFTIREERGTVNKIVVSIVGDLKYGRTVHSLVRLLSNYNVTFNFVSIPELSLDRSTRDFLNDREIAYNQYKSIHDVIETTDVLYMTRIQKERLMGENLDSDLEFIENNLYLTQEIMTNAKQNMVIMHPLPRNEELNPNLDNDPRAAYFRQMENGLYVRMALMQLLL